MNSWIYKLCLLVLLATSCIGQQIKCVSPRPICFFNKWGDPTIPKGYKLETLSQTLQAINYGLVINQNQKTYEERCLYEDLVNVISEIFSDIPLLQFNIEPISTTYMNQGSEIFKTHLLRNNNQKTELPLETKIENELAEAYLMSSKQFNCKCTVEMKNKLCRCKNVFPHAIERLYGKFKTLKAKKPRDKYQANKPNYG